MDEFSKDHLFAERDELQALIGKLTVDINIERCYPQTSDTDLALMEKQLRAMRRFYAILECRCEIL